MVHQDYRLLTDRTVVENVALPLIIAGMHPKDANTRAMASLDRVGLRNKAHYLPPQISGGSSNVLILRVRLCINLNSYWQMNQRVI